MAKKRSSRKSKRRQKKPKRRSWLLRLLFAGLLAVAAVSLVYAGLAWTYDLDQLGTMPERTIVYDRFGEEFGRLHGENRVTTQLENVSPHFVDALLAREDSRFFSHPGLDPIGIGRAIVRNIQSGRFREGASTLTQQLARNSYALGGRNLHRKALEAFLALRIERAKSKKEILELYLNRIFYGRGLYGLETATQAYFGKSAADLTLGEAATMSGLIRSPNRFNPIANLEAAERERDMVLGRMEQLGMITETEAAAARNASLDLSRHRPVRQANYALATVADELAQILSDRQMDDGGLRVYTSLDPKLQSSAESALAQTLTQFERRSGYRHRTKRNSQVRPTDTATPYLQGAAIVMDNASGGLRAIVGGRDYQESRFNRARYARRQVGSTLKPFIYTLAWQAGLLPGTWVQDGAIGSGEIRGAEGWRPRNADGQTLGWQTAETGLILSRNTMSVRIGNVIGVDRLADWLRRAGFETEPERSPTLYLGAFEASLQELVAAYAALANAGIKRQPYVIGKVETQSGRPVFLATRAEYQLLDPAPSWVTTEVLATALDKGTGRSANIDFPAAGKTGTTNDARDVWFVGYTENLTCGVWAGFDQPKPIGAGAAGSSLALPVWAKIMRTAQKIDPAPGFVADVREAPATLCHRSGRLARNGCYHADSSYTSEIPTALTPQQLCNVHDGYQIDAEFEQKPASLPERTWRSIGRLFGGD